MVSGPTVILLPPSEGKAAGGTGSYAWADGQFPILAAARAQVGTALAAAVISDPASTLGLAGSQLAAAVAVATFGYVGAPACPAHDRYTGVVYDALGDSAASASVAARARRELYILSGLLGLVRFDDPTPEYRARVGLRLMLDGQIVTLAAWWRPHLTAALIASQPGAVWDVLTTEHRRMIDWTALCEAGISVHRVEFICADGRGAKGHSAKAAKGALVRLALEEGWEAARAHLAGGFGSGPLAGAATSFARGGGLTVILP